MMPDSEPPPSGHEASLVSVVIPTYNRARLLEQTLESVAGAQWRPIEIVVADDGSTDDTKERVAAFASVHSDIRVRFLELAHAGAIAARNAGVDACTGEYVYFLDSDDLLQPGGLAAMVEALADPAVPYCVAQLAEADLAGKVVFAEGHTDSILDYEGVVGSQWPTIVGFYPRSLLERLGAFDASLDMGEDKEFLWRIVAGAGRPGKVIGEVVALRRNHDLGQITDLYTPVVMGQHTIAALDAFVGWAIRHDRMRAAIARAAYPKLWIATVRVGAAGERAWVERAVALARRLETHAPTPANRLSRIAMANLPRCGFSALFALMAAARGALHAYRNARRRLSS